MLYNVLEKKTDYAKDVSVNYYVSEFDMHEDGMVVCISMKPLKDKTKIKFVDFTFRFRQTFHDLDKAINYIKVKYKNPRELHSKQYHEVFDRFKVIKIYDVD